MAEMAEEPEEQWWSEYEAEELRHDAWEMNKGAGAAVRSRTESGAGSGTGEGVDGKADGGGGAGGEAEGAAGVGECPICLSSDGRALQACGVCVYALCGPCVNRLTHPRCPFCRSPWTRAVALAPAVPHAGPMPHVTFALNDAPINVVRSVSRSASDDNLRRPYVYSPFPSDEEIPYLAVPVPVRSPIRPQAPGPTHYPAASRSSLSSNTALSPIFIPFA